MFNIPYENQICQIAEEEGFRYPQSDANRLMLMSTLIIHLYNKCCDEECCDEEPECRVEKPAIPPKRKKRKKRRKLAKCKC